MAIDLLKVQEGIDQIVELKEAADPIIAGVKDATKGTTGSSSGNPSRAQDGYYRNDRPDAPKRPRPTSAGGDGVTSAMPSTTITIGAEPGYVASYVAAVKANPVVAAVGATALAGLGWMFWRRM